MGRVWAGRGRRVRVIIEVADGVGIEPVGKKWAGWAWGWTGSQDGAGGATGRLRLR